MQTTDFYHLNLRVQFISGRHHICPPDWAVNGYILPFNKLYFVMDGELFIELDGKTHHLQRGDMICIPRGKKHSMRHGKKQYADMYFMHFALELADGMNFFDYPDFSTDVATVSFTTDFELMCTLFQDMFNNTMLKHHLAARTHLNASCLQIVSYYIEKQLRASGKHSVPFIEIINYMQNTLGGTSLRTLADMAYLSPEHFVRKFKAAHGIAPMKYYDRLRIDFATAAIRDDKLTFMEIAEQLGISNLAYFSKFFKKHVGLSPNGYRKACRQKVLMYVENGQNNPTSL